jgi:hypothetical protein
MVGPRSSALLRARALRAFRPAAIALAVNRAPRSPPSLFPRRFAPRIKEWLADQGSMVVGGSPTDYGRLLAEETEKWGKVIRAANIKLQ